MFFAAYDVRRSAAHVPRTPLAYDTSVTPRREERVFLIRMWLEPETTDRRRWRGSVYDVASGRKRYVTGGAEIGDVIDAGLADAPAARMPSDERNAEP